MAFDAFIKIDRIDGESSDDKYSGWIEILYYDIGISQKVSTTQSSAGGASAERADFRDFRFQKELDVATPKLALACADGTHINKVSIEICRAGSDKTKFMEYKLSNCIISNCKTETGGAFPYDEVSINYGQIEWIYAQQLRVGGGVAGNVVTGWCLERNCKL